MTTEQRVAEALKRLHRYINRCTSQQMRRMKEGWAK